MPVVKQIPKMVRPYLAHGVQLALKEGAEDVYGTCPFCGREGKFSVNVATGQCRCLVCNTGAEETRKVFQGGNIYTFLRLLWKRGVEAGWGDGAAAGLAKERGLLDEATLDAWGVCLGPLTNEWVLPGYGADGKLNTLYRYVQERGGGKSLYVTPETNHQLFGVPLYDKAKPRVYLCEGPWDAMALYEVLRSAKKDVQGYSFTAAEGFSLYAGANVLAVAGCSVFNEAWLPLFAGKRVTLCFDSDHPKLHCKRCKVSHSSVTYHLCPRCNGALSPPEMPPAGYDGMRRVARCLASSREHAPESIHILRWGPDGYDPVRKSGWDVRDHLCQGANAPHRVAPLQELLGKVEPMPPDWVEGRTAGAAEQGGTELALLPCHTYAQVVASAREVLEFTEGLDRALSILYAIILSTKGGGDQLWGMFVGPASCGKSTLAEAVSTAAQWVTAKSTIRGFHSGYKSDGSGKEDNSLIPLVLDKTLVTKDGDTLLQSPNLPQILAEARDLYDRTARTHYRHGLSRDYQGINVTWALFGTGAMDAIDRSELGQRFLKIVLMDRIDDDLEELILLRKARQANDDLNHESNGQPSSRQSPAMTTFMQTAGGYVHYLRSNAGELLRAADVGEEAQRECTRYARFVAYLRARPSRVQKETAERELAARLTSQLVRLAKCLCVVLNKTEADAEVMRRVRRTALDTARGRTLRIAEALYKAEPRGMEVRSLAIVVNETEQDIRELLTFMGRIGAAEVFKTQLAPNAFGEPRWKLTPKLIELYRQTVGGQ